MKVQLSVDSEDCDLYPFPDSNALIRVFESEIESLWSQDIIKPEIIEIAISIISQNDMKEQNNRFRGIDSATDVLSFPMWENNGEFLPLPEIECPTLMLGDILLCPEKISENAALNGSEYIEELCLVLAHSLLHLFCWDHETEENEEIMWKRQDIIKSRIMGELRRT